MMAVKQAANGIKNCRLFPERALAEERTYKGFVLAVGCLSADAQLFNNFLVAIHVFRLEVIEKIAPSTDEAQQPTARVKVLWLLLEMLSQVDDSGCQQGNLNFC